MVIVDKLDIIKDARVNCYSVIIQFTVEEYLNMVQRAFQNRGGLEKQRDTLKTTTAIRIRKRMVQDIKSGAVLPPIVIGAIIPLEQLTTIEKIENNNEFLRFVNQIPPDNISIIDGMQRTSALNEALNEVLDDNHELENRKIRIEFWIASQINSLTYRMLVLNTGQVPWNLRRQIETVFKLIIKEIQQKYPDIEIMEINEERRRKRSGQFQADNVIELFLVFGAKKEKIDVQERLADEFTKLDFIESTSNENFTNIFYEVIYFLSKFDNAIASYQGENIEGYFKEGKDLFSSQPACVGFVTAIALATLGRPGNKKYTPEKQNQKWQEIKINAEQLLQRLQRFNSEEIGEFLDFVTLNELISRKPAKSNEREFFLKTFEVLIEENFDVENMNPCWRAY
ncbi:MULTISPECIES: hypothetical protein [Nostocales]|uniref:hypothetical protein n=1 Tax=Nostocales TaxID=1161 RepID=UPI00029B6B36|nr:MULTISPECIES: hypothetical protein [Nostocales]AFW94714.1 hypothetical protein ANA_C11960 [Anabaena sp. 90]MBO1068858.1 hypothetical protein [Dolichospermum sp. DEX189]MTJ17576.1 hypothetical protein [Dolichospermum sp. UHCC 0299]MTJ38286.1 hypothetical protein [Dolichospermum sp. UHCC 0406]